jgi:CubicO group peptidase (beta-lactamase class C family)
MKALSAILLLLSTTTALAQNPAVRLAGVWGAELNFGPETGVRLILEQGSASMIGRIASRSVTARGARGKIEFDFGDDVGSFRGQFTPDSSAAEGHWLQPAHITSGYRYATPTRLTRDRNGWTGTLQPLENRFAAYLVIRARGDTVRAFIRNPEANLWAERHFDVRVDGAKLLLINGNAANDTIRGRYDAGANRVFLTLNELNDREVEFSLRDRNRAVGFYPRTPEPSRYDYVQPSGRNDGWRTGSLGEVKLDTASIDSLVRQIIGTPARNVFSPYIHSLLIARNGKLVVEEYFHGYRAEQTHDSRSLGKSFAAALVGAAQQQGVSLTPSTPVLPFFKYMGALENPDARKQQLQLRHFMTMTTGLDCDDNNWESAGSEPRMQRQDRQPDYVHYTLDLRMLHDPGKHYAYCSAATNLVGGVVERATGTWLPDFFYRYIAQPLQFGTYHFQLTPTLSGYLGGGSYYTPRDLLKLGQLWLNGGSWNGRQIVPRAWTEITVRADSLLNAPGEGYHWHLNVLKAGGREWREYEGNGNGGQFVIVLPELDMVIGFTAGNYMNYGTWRKFRDELVPQFIIAAVR